MSASGRTGRPRETRSMGNVVESDQVIPSVLGVHDDRCDPLRRSGRHHRSIPPQQPPPPLLISTVFGRALSTVTVRTEPDWTATPLVRGLRSEFLWMCTLARENGVRRNVQDRPRRAVGLVRGLVRLNVI